MRRRNAFFLSLVFGSPGIASGGTLRVPSEYASILAAVDAAAAGDTVLVAAGTYRHLETRTLGTGTFSAGAFLNDDIVIRGESGAASTTFQLGPPGDTATSFAVVQRATSGDPTWRIEGLTIRGVGDRTMGVLAWGGNLEIRGCRFEDLGASYETHGGAVHLSGTSATIHSSVFRDCSASRGSAVYLHADRAETVVIDGCDFRRCNGALYLEGHGSIPNDEAGDVRIRNSRFEDNRAPVYHEDLAHLGVRDCVFRGNSGTCIGMRNGGRNDFGHSNIFIRNNLITDHHGLGIGTSNFGGTIENNLFRQCTGGAVSTGPSALVRMHIRSNVFVETSGAPALRGSAAGTYSNSCNFFWNNPAGDLAGITAVGSVFIDPLLCGRGFQLQQNSPCLSQNNGGLCDVGPPAVIACAPGPEVPVGITTVPSGLNVSWDGFIGPAPALIGRLPGDIVSIGAVATQVTKVGERSVFQSWSDGGAIAHDVTAGSAFTSYEATFVPERLLTVTSDTTGSVDVQTGWRPKGDFVSLTATPAPGFVFDGWRGSGRGHYTGPANPAQITLDHPITQDAKFVPDLFDLTMQADVGGTVSPGSATLPFGSSVQIEAFPVPYYVWDRWSGQGGGSYSGPDNPATVTVGGHVTQKALFRRISHEVVLSLSDTDPYVTSGPPPGAGGHVYLWLACSTSGGVISLQADLTGSIIPAAFVPSPGILNGGSATRIKLAPSHCITGPSLLGTIVVNDIVGGDLCLAPATDIGALRIVGCDGRNMLTYDWPRDMRIGGIRTDGGAPCASGRACQEEARSPIRAAIVDPDPRAPGRLSLAVHPNPSHGPAEIALVLDRNERISVSIFDVRGRLVRRFDEAQYAPGAHRLRWNGTNRDGQLVPDGIYFARVRAGDQSVSRKVTIIRNR